jgi:hypothetical protein
MSTRRDPDAALFALSLAALFTSVGCGSDSATATPPSKCDPGTKCGVLDSGAGGAGTGGAGTGGAKTTGGAPGTGGASTGGKIGSGGAPAADSGGVDSSDSSAPDGGDGRSCFSAPTGDAGAVSGSNAGALHFDGVDDTVLLYSGSQIASETAFTEEAWFRTSSPTGSIIEVFSASGGADRSLYLLDGKVCFYVYEPAFSATCTPAAAYADGAWHHAAGSLGACGQYLVVDGKVEASAPQTTSSGFNFEDSLRLGYGHTGANTAFAYFAGDLDDVRVWSVQRSPAEIAIGLGGLVDAAAPGLLGYWKLDDKGSSATAVDATSGNHDGTLNGFTFTSSPWLATGAF